MLGFLEEPEMRFIRYAGIGPRDITEPVANVLTVIAQGLCDSNCWLHSGWGRGSDQAFAAGSAINRQTQFIPWESFNDANKIPQENLGEHDPFMVVNHSEQSMRLASQYHPYWNRMHQNTKLLMSRNVFILLGADLQTPVDFVVFWQSLEDDQSVTSGTNHTRRMAQSFGIPLFNMRVPADQDALVNHVFIKQGELQGVR